MNGTKWEQLSEIADNTTPAPTIPNGVEKEVIGEEEKILVGEEEIKIEIEKDKTEKEKTEKDKIEELGREVTELKLKLEKETAARLALESKFDSILSRLAELEKSKSKE